MFETSEDRQMNIELPRWADHMIEYLLARVKDTVHLLQKSNSLALNDEISQLPNHRAATLYLKDVFEEYCMNQTKFSILFVDGDNLKRYNDYGYHCGNEMIRNLGELITSSIRHSDRVFRWLSGDEFLIVLKDISKKTAYIMAERIRNHVEKATKSWRYPVTVSIGVANCPIDGTDMNTVLDKAVSSNRQAKKSGKNCVM